MRIPVAIYTTSTTSTKCELCEVSVLPLSLVPYITVRDVTKFEFEFDNVRTSNIFTRFEIRRMF